MLCFVLINSAIFNLLYVWIGGNMIIWMYVLQADMYSRQYLANEEHSPEEFIA